MSIDPAAAAIGVVGIVLTLTQVYFNRKRHVSEETFRIIEKLNSHEARLARFQVGDVLELAEQNESDFGKLKDEDLVTLSSVSALFGYVGLLADRKKIETNLIIELWGGVIQSNWKKLTPYREYWESRFGSAIGQWKYFEQLAGRCKIQSESSINS